MSIASIAREVERDRYGRPLIVPPAGGKPVAYTRATTLAGALDDLHGLMGWKQRMTAIGITDRPDLQVAVSAHRDDKKKLDAVVKEAMEAAAASAAATTGTALHAFTEQIDRGTPPTSVPVKFQADLEAYIEATKDFTALHIEQMSVVDDLRIAGTPDRIVEYGGELYVADLKTGSIDFPHKIALQLALYARAQKYDIATGQRSPWDATRKVNTEQAIIIHLAAGTGICRLVWVDIAAGWHAVDLALKVRDWRKQRNLTTELDRIAADVTLPLPSGANEDRLEYAALEEAVAVAKSEAELLQLWEANQATWTPDLTALAAARKALLTNGLIAPTK